MGGRQDVPGKLARSLPSHEIHTVVSVEWGGIKNGALLTLIEGEGFNVFLTGDKNMEKQQRLEGRSFAVLVMSAINRPVVRSHIEKISVAIDNARAWRVQKFVDPGILHNHAE